MAVIKANPNTDAIGFEYADIKKLKVSSCDSGFISGTETIIHGGYDGYIYKQESGNSFTRASATATIDGLYRSPDMTMGDPGLRKSMQRVIWNIDNDGDISSTFKLIYDFASTEVPQPTPYSLTVGGGVAIYGNSLSTYGTAVYDSSGVSLLRNAVEGGGFTVAVKLDDTSTDKPISLKGFELEFLPGGRR